VTLTAPRHEGRAEGRRGQTLAAAVASPRLTPFLLLLAGVIIAVSVTAMGVSLGRQPERCAPVGLPTHPSADPMPRSQPVGLNVGGIDACSSLQPVGVDTARRIEVPSVHTPEQAGWYRLGPTPGQRGPAVIVGHVNGDGREGVFADLADVEPGAVIAVSRQDGTTAYFGVTGTVQVPKNAFPTRSVYGDTDGAELRLITCGGALDRSRHDYDDNVVVFAALIGWR
jgi:hypothetical protein